MLKRSAEQPTAKKTTKATAEADDSTSTSTSTPDDTLSIDDIRDVRSRTLLNRLMLEDRAYAAEEDLNKKLRAQLRPRIEALLSKLKVKRAIKGEQWHAVLVAGRSTLSAELLVLHGVDVETINKCKKKGKAAWQIRGVEVKQAKKADEENGDD